MRSLPLILVAFVALCAGASAQAGTSGELAPGEWKPYLTEARDWFSTELRDAPGQQGMNLLSARAAELADAELFIVYVRLAERLDEPSRKSLLEEQRAWLVERSKRAREAAKSEEGGSLAQFEANKAELELTDLRLGELRERLQKLEAK